MSHFAYIMRCADNTLYCGYTTDPIAREKAHNSAKGAKYTRSRLPVKLVYCEEFESKSNALKREAALKRLSHAQKEALIFDYICRNSAE